MVRHVVTDGCQYVPYTGPSRNDGCPHVSHDLVKVWHAFHVLLRLSTDETWTPGSFEARLCTRYEKGLPTNEPIAIFVSGEQPVVSDRSRTQRSLARRARKASNYGPPLSLVTAYYVQSRLVAFTPFCYGLLGFSSAPRLPWQFCWRFKNLARHPQQWWPVTLAHSVPHPHCLTSIPFCPQWPETWLPWPPGT